MSCECAYPTNEFHGWGCTFNAGKCRFQFPDSKTCAEIFNEGPDAILRIIHPQSSPQKPKKIL